MRTRCVLISLFVALLAEIKDSRIVKKRAINTTIPRYVPCHRS